MYYIAVLFGEVFLGKDREQQHLQVGGPAGVGVSFTL